METKNYENPDSDQPTPRTAAGDEVGSGETTQAAGDTAGDASGEETASGADRPDEPADTPSPGDTGTNPGSDPDNPADNTGDTRPSDEPDGDTPDGEDSGKSGGEFEERFLNNGAAEETPEKRRESLAASLIRMALALLTGEVPEERFIPLMDGVIAHEAIERARAEGEIAGRNAIIEEQLATPSIAPPDLNGTPIARSRRRATSIFDLADLAR